MSRNLWKIPTGKIRTPGHILKEQAALLTQATNGVLIGETQTQSNDNTLHTFLSIRVPSLNNYRIQLLRYSQPLSIYPGNLIVDIRNQLLSINDEQHFETALTEILGSPDMERILGSLLSQVP